MSLNQFEQFAMAHYFKSYPSNRSFTEITLAMNEYVPYTKSSKEVIDQLIFCEQYKHSSLHQIAESMKVMVSDLESQFIERPPLSAAHQLLKSTLQLLGNAKSVEVCLDTASGLTASAEIIDYDEHGGEVNYFCDEKILYEVRSALLGLARICLNEKFPGWEGSSRVGLYFNLDGSVHIDFQWVRTEESEATMQL